MSSRLEVICGPMFSGKTTELLRRIQAARALMQSVLVVKPTGDHRYATDSIVTHTGDRMASIAVDDLREVLSLALAQDASFIAIDEIHFFGQPAAEPIAHLLARGCRVLVAGCDLDHFGAAFEPFPTLFPLAHEIVRLSGSCSSCGGPSTHTQRMIASTQRIIVGNSGDYEPRCAACFTPSVR
ncbi:MAG: thymidine kinase [Phycisphaerales bacterium]|nr:thymidine kinase [Phycisphaerales bacterium]